MFEDGRVQWDETGRAQIYLRKDRVETRKRFTLAHELAHVALAGSPGKRIAFRAPSSGDDEEGFCDAVAAAVLMPRPWMQQFIASPPNLSRVRLVGHRANVSLAAAATRLAEVSGNISVLLRWQEAGDRWVCRYSAAVPSSLVGRIEMSPSAATMVRASGFRDAWHDLDLVFEHQLVACHAHVSRDSMGCLMLITAMSVPAHRPDSPPVADRRTRIRENSASHYLR